MVIESMLLSLNAVRRAADSSSGMFSTTFETEQVAPILLAFWMDRISSKKLSVLAMVPPYYRVIITHVQHLRPAQILLSTANPQLLDIAE